jgi:DNA mismatch endonuclease, patch repair protein
MAAVRSRNTAPEIFVRKLLHAMGKRYRLHVKELPGTPDIVLPRHKTVVQVYGCFWHGHACKRGRRPATRRDFWNDKIDSNMRRDRISEEALRVLGWRVEVVWGCEIKDAVALGQRLREMF